MKKCSHCKFEKENTEFIRDRQASTGLSSWCRECQRGQKRYTPVDPTLARQHHQEAMRQRWVRYGEVLRKGIQRRWNEHNARNAFASEYWTRDRMFSRFRHSTLWWVLFLRLWVAELQQREIRHQERVEKKRRYALEAWRLRGKAARQAKVHNSSRLESLCRKALERQTRRQEKEKARLFKAADSVVEKSHSRSRAKLVRRLRRYFEMAIHVGSKSARIRELLGCTVEEFRQHLEKQFRPGMTWANHSWEGWHIDHIRPLASFDLADPEQQKQAFHFSNMQPLWKAENLAKSDKVDSPAVSCEASA